MVRVFQTNFPQSIRSMSSDNPSRKTSYFSTICIEKCKGRCCNPWWGIISFTINRNGGLSDPVNFKKELIKNITARKERIQVQYVTRERLPRRLFNAPDKQHVSVENIRVRNNTISLTLRAMFAFRCHFLSPENACTIHPAATGTDDIRPPHCGYMGTPNAVPNEKGYCRIIHTADASTSDNATIAKAINMEQAVSDRFFYESVDSTTEAADKIINFIRDYCRAKAPHLLEIERKSGRPGRNEPCYCGSGKKYKKCHGK